MDSKSQKLSERGRESRPECEESPAGSDKSWQMGGTINRQMGS